MITAQEAGDDAMAQAEMATWPPWPQPGIIRWAGKSSVCGKPRPKPRWPAERELARRPQAGLELRLSYPRLLVMVKRYDAARDAFVQLSNKYPHQPEVAYAIGVLSYELKDYEEAERSLRDAGAGLPRAGFCTLHPGPDGGRAQTAARSRQLVRSHHQRPATAAGTKPAGGAGSRRRRWTPRWLGWSAWPTCKHPRPARVLAQAQLARNAEQPDRALAILSAALAKDGNVAEWRYERALLLDDRERVAEAERDLRAYLNSNPRARKG